MRVDNDRMSSSHGSHAHVVRPPVRGGRAGLAVHLLQVARPAVVQSSTTVLAVDASRKTSQVVVGDQRRQTLSSLGLVARLALLLLPTTPARRHIGHTASRALSNDAASQTQRQSDLARYDLC